MSKTSEGMELTTDKPSSNARGEMNQQDSISTNNTQVAVQPLSDSEKLTAVRKELEDTKKRLRQQAQEQKGKKRDAVSRADLLKEFTLQMSNEHPDHRRVAWNMILSEQYAPSVASLKSLDKIMLDNLLLETHHHGNVLILRTIGRPVMRSSTLNAYAVEDETGNVERLSIFDFGVTDWASKVIPENACFAIKEPYFKTVVHEKSTLCVDHPSDILFLEDDHEMVPDIWKIAPKGKTALEWKIQGNEALKKKQYLEAEKCYSKGIAAIDIEDQTLKRDLHRNRAQVRLHLAHYDGAYADAMASLTHHHDETSKAQDAKAFFRAGRAAYELRDFPSALTAFTSMLSISPSDVDGLREMKRTEQRIREQETGIYDWITAGPLEPGTKLDHASFTRRTEIRQTENRGRGSFATELIPHGSLVLCEKALLFDSTPAMPTSFNLVIPLTSTRDTFGTQSNTWSSSIQKLLHNPSLAYKILDLHAGPNFPALPNLDLQIVDNKPLIDVFRVENAIEYNSFGYTRDPRSSRFGNACLATSQGIDGNIGLWTHTAYTNHSCLFNAQHSFIGDMLILRATRDISKGEEILAHYREVDAEYTAREAALGSWGFVCQCGLCVADRACGDLDWDGRAASSMLARRKNLLDESKCLLERYPLHKANTSSPETIDLFESLLSDLEMTYPQPLYANLPRLGLAPLHQYIAFFYSSRDTEKALKHSLSVIDAHGYNINIEEEDVDMDCENAIPTPLVVNQLMNVSLMMQGKGEEKLAEKVRELALRVYVIINGEPSGF